MIDYGTLLNKYMQPLGSPVDNSNTQTKYVPWQWGIQQGLQVKKIRSSGGYFAKVSSGSILGNKTFNGTLRNTFTVATANNLGAATLYTDSDHNRHGVFDGTNNRIFIGSI
jgi:hypothetical protein